ncbi:ATP synthase F0 subunit B [Anaerobacillus alkalidiazotrophicus]|uniref:ATP synthase subunit b n=1 Tax=Anaerobacillus alkalidiazotrophicus TaxID=472963 RepID=A0A1S2MB20_9BACI|nr:F0F1 ATP synthase subunit B [Anaerobacillus alkalidiazotrophicus]OIJ21790.1 ATP synthase F0 subunit B [Anaerobacillus alkalidiazotrophicus]
MFENIPWINAFYQLIVFFILLMLLKKYAFGPVIAMMQKREEHIANQISSAEKNREQAETYLAEQREEIKRAREEAQNIIANAKKISEQQTQEMIQAAKEESDRMKENALAEIKREKEQAVSTLREQVASLSVLVATKVIERELDEKSQEKLIADYLKEVGEEL